MTKSKQTREVTGQTLSTTGAVPTTETVIDTFVPSNASIIKDTVTKMIGMSKKIASKRAEFLSTLTGASITVFEELVGLKRTGTIDSVKGTLWSVSGFGDLDFSDTKYKWASELLLEAVRSAQLVHDFDEYRLENGVFECMEKVSKPMIDELDRFDNKIKGSKVPNESETFGAVPSKSVPGYFNLQYPGSVEKRGTKKSAAKDQVDASASKEQVLDDFAHMIANKGKPTTAAGWRLVHAIRHCDITSIECLKALEAITNADPSAIDGVRSVAGIDASGKSIAA
jgi:hypothetical protein